MLLERTKEDQKRDQMTMMTCELTELLRNVLENDEVSVWWFTDDELNLMQDIVKKIVESWGHTGEFLFHGEELTKFEVLARKIGHYNN